jgi:thiamine-monophosphate kinase
VDDDRSRATVGELGERGLIERITPRFGPPVTGEVWSGDDTAAFPSPDDGEILFTTDLMVEDVDFRLSYSSGFDVGWKLIAANASDIAAMGGRPWRAVASVALRPDTEVAFVDALAEGMATLSKDLGLGLVGGDFSAGRDISASVAMLGIATGDPVMRNGARVGDSLCVTGSLGGAAGGLIVLEEEIDAPDSGDRQALVAASQRPRPRVAEGQILAGYARAMIDLSDGLAVDLGHLTKASNVGCEIDLDAVPLHESLEWLHGRRTQADPMSLAVTGGEDFELLMSLDDSDLSEVSARLGELGTSLTRIGIVTDGPARIGNRDLDDWRTEGWEHLQSR